MSILARRELRLAAIAAIAAVTGVTVDSPGDWSIAPSRLPNIKLRTPVDRKASITRTMPEFTTTVTIEILATLQAGSDAAAQDAIEALGQQLELALFGAQPLVKLCQQFSSVTTETDITAEGEVHIARIRLALDCEVFEAFDPTEINPADYPALQQLNVHVDLAQPFDASGSYPNLSFPASVKPAPRSTGPDGRDEGFVQVNFP